MNRGIVVAWSGWAPVRKALRAPVAIGRDMFPDDDRISRDHLEVKPFERDGQFVLHDIKSRNGTYLDRHKMDTTAIVKPGAVLRAGRTVGVLVPDVSIYDDSEGPPLGPWHVVRLVVAAVQREAPALATHPTFVEWCLASPFADEDAVTRTATAIAQHCLARGKDKLTGDLADELGKHAVEVAFSLHYRARLDALPPFRIPARCVALDADMTGTPHGPRLETASLDELAALPDGWFQAGVTDAAIYYGFANWKKRVFVRVPYSADTRDRAVASVRRLAHAVDSMPCKSFALVQSSAGAAYRIVRGDNSVGEQRADSIDAFDYAEAMSLARATNQHDTFAGLFERIMKEPPPFDIPERYVVLDTMERGGRVETMIGSGMGDTLLVQAEVGNATHMPIGWFQAGFWGHGVNSYAFYYGRATERSRVYLRVRYGEGVYESDKDGARASALATLKKYIKLAETLPCKHVTLIQSMDGAHWRIEKLDGTVIEMPHEKDEFCSYLDSFDFEELVK